MKTICWFVLAAFSEIAGCFSVWAWLRLSRSAYWLVPGAVSLFLFAYFLTRVDTAFAGRAYAAYGGVYIVASLLWLALVERTLPDRYDCAGALLCLAGTAFMLWPRTA